MSYPFVQTDAGRSLSKRPKQSNDCTVRAIVLATKLPYDIVYEELAKLGRKSFKGWHIKNHLDKHGEILGYKFSKLYFPGIKGERRMNPVTFSQTFKEGTYIVRTAKHVFTFIDGVAYDTGQSYDERCIYLAWKLIN